MRPGWQNVMTMLWAGVEPAEQDKIKAFLEAWAKRDTSAPAAKVADEDKDLKAEKQLSTLGPFARSLRDALDRGEIVGWVKNGELVEVPEQDRSNLYIVAEDMANAYFSLYDKTGVLLADPIKSTRKACLRTVRRIVEASTPAEKIFHRIRISFLKFGVVTINELQAQRAMQDRLADLAGKNQEKQRKEKEAREREQKLPKGSLEFRNLPKEPDWDEHAVTASDKLFLSVLVKRIKANKYDGQYLVTCAMYENGQLYGEAESSTARGEQGHPIADFLMSQVIEKMGRDPRSCSEYTLLLWYLNEKFPGLRGPVASLANYNISQNVRTVARALGKINGQWYIEGMDACLNCQQWLELLGWSWAPGLASKV